MPIRATIAALLIALSGGTFAGVPADVVTQGDELPARDPRVQALDAGYRRQVIVAHAGSSDARRVLAAAMLQALEPLQERFAGGEVGQAAVDAADADPRMATAVQLYERALALGSGDALVLWAIATLQNQRNPALERVAARASERLVEVDPDNAAVWLERLHRRRHALGVEEEDALLARAARATHHSLYYAELGRLLAAAFAEVPMLPELRDRLAAETGSEEDLDTLHLVRALSIVLGVAPPPIRALFDLCAEPAQVDDQRRAHCLALGRRMATTADTVIGQSLGLQLWGRAATGPGDREAQQQARRTARWLQEAYGELLSEGFPAGSPHWAHASDLWLTPGVSELEVQRRVLERAGVPLVPPAEFRPDVR